MSAEPPCLPTAPRPAPLRNLLAKSNRLEHPPHDLVCAPTNRRWQIGAEELASEIADELLLPPSSLHCPVRLLRRDYALSDVRLLLTGHGAGALSAYLTALLLLQRHPALSPILRCVTFGMPMMGFGSPTERALLLAGSWEGAGRLPHFHFVVRWDDPIPTSTLSSREARRPIRDAAERTLLAHGGNMVGDEGRGQAGGARQIAEWWPWGTFWFLQDGAGYGGGCDIEAARLGGGDSAEFGVLEACIVGSGRGGVGEHHCGRYVCSVHACLGGGGGWACRPRVDSAVGMCVREGARSYLEVSLRGQNLHYIDEVGTAMGARRAIHYQTSSAGQVGGVNAAVAAMRDSALAT